MKRLGILLLFLFLLYSFECSLSTYTIIGPNVIRPDTDYFVSVSTQYIHEDQDVSLAIMGETDAEQQSIVISEKSIIHPNETQIVRLRIGNLGAGSYKLVASGKSPIEFKESSSNLKYIHQGYVVFIQTDKAIYRPGNRIKFRVLLTSSLLKPSVVGSIDVKIHDGKKHLIKKFDRVFTTNGVFSGELQLDEFPVMGNWSITADVSGQIYTTTLLVANYVLPKFIIDIDVPKYGLFHEEYTKIVVRAYYYNGGGILNGQVTLAAFPKYKSSYLQPIFSDPFRKVMSLQGGQAIFEYNLPNELSLNSEYDREIVLDVQVKEDLTERLQNNTASFWMYKYPYKLELIRTAEAFKPGLPYTAYLKVAYQDDSPVQDDLNLVSIKWGFSNEQNSSNSKYNVSSYSIPSQHGIIPLVFDTPASAEVLGMEATYKGLVQWFSTIPKASPGEYLQASLLTHVPTVGKMIQISLASTASDSSALIYSYQVFGRGRLVITDTVYRPFIEFNGTFSMSPSCLLLVYYISKAGVLIADSLEFDVKGILETNNNFVEITTTKRQTFPGKDLTVNIKSKPNSFVGLLAVDTNVRYLNKLNTDLTQSQMIEKLKEFDVSDDPYFFKWAQEIQEPVLSWKMGSLSPKATFERAGTLILTNAVLKDKEMYRGDVEPKGNRPFGRPLPRPGIPTLNADKGPGLEYESATRPPLAGPYAFSHLPVPVDNAPKIYVKNDLPESWLFINVTTDSEGRASIPVRSSEITNTSWDITAFSLNSLQGLGISVNASTVDVFQPFYVHVEVPPVVKRGEHVAVQIIVYNYLSSSDIKASVTLENPGGTGFIFGAKFKRDGKTIDLFQTKDITVRPGRGTLLTFIITPVEIGELEMKITAKSPVGQDIQLEKLNVEPEGETHRVNRGFLLDLRNKKELFQNFTIEMPAFIVNDSERIYISGISDLLGTSMNNLRNLIHYSSRSGEPNLIQMIPSAILAKYLESLKDFDSSLKDSAIQSMKAGYQSQLTYRNEEDGSFTSFSPGEGSIWVTASVVSAFALAKPFIDIDEDVLRTAMKWLRDQQDSEGFFLEKTSVIHHTVMQESKVALTAFVVSAFIDNKHELTSELRNAMNRGIDYLASHVPNDDVYSLAIASYILLRAQHPSKDQVLSALESSMKSKSNESHSFWQKESFSTGNPWSLFNSNSYNNEITSYALLALLYDDSKFETAISIANWLLAQQNANGGFASSSDTIIGLKALTSFNEKLREKISGDKASSLEVRYSYLNTVRKISISSSSTANIRQILPKATRFIEVKASGSGIGLLQIGYEYNLNVTGAWPSFVLDPRVFKSSTANWMKVTVCVNFVQDGPHRYSNMAVMEIDLPSGFTIDSDSLPALKRYQGVSRVDAVKSNTRVVLYFQTLTESEVCPTISAFRTFRVGNQKPALIRVYDYYDQSRVARSFYDVVPATLCDICAGDDCPEENCDNTPTFGSFFGDNVDSNRESNSLSSVLLCNILVLTASLIVTVLY